MNNHGSSNPAASYRSYGHLLKQLAKGDEQARNDYEQISKRDYTGGVLANSDPQRYGSATRFASSNSAAASPTSCPTPRCRPKARR